MMGLDTRVLNASEEERSRIAPVKAVRFDPHFPVTPTEVTPAEIKPYDPNSVYGGKHFGQSASGDGK